MHASGWWIIGGALLLIVLSTISGIRNRHSFIDLWVVVFVVACLALLLDEKLPPHGATAFYLLVLVAALASCLAWWRSRRAVQPNTANAGAEGSRPSGGVTRVLLTSIILLSSVFGCGGERTVTIDFVLPDSYAGYFWIIADPKVGVRLKEVDGVVEVRIPEDGILRVADDALLYGPRKYNAATYSGTSLKTVTADDAASDERVLRSLETSSEGVHTFLVGTAAEARAFHANPSEATLELRERLSQPEP